MDKNAVTKIGIKAFSVALLILLFATAAATATTVSIADAVVEPDDVVTLPIVIDDITNYGTGTMNIGYDPSVVQVTDVTGSPDSNVIAENIDNTAGSVRILASNLGGVSGDIVFANVKFTAIGPGTTSLNIGVSELCDTSYNDISADISDGSITSPTTHSTSSNGGSTTGAVSITTPTPVPSPTPAPSAEDGANPASTSESTPHNDGGAGEETDASGTTSSTVKPTPESQMSISGFEAIFAVIGLMILSLILRRDNT